MVKKLVVLLTTTAVMLCASALHPVQGEIDAHTEVFGDGSINPSVKKIQSDLRMQNDDPTTLRGRIWFAIADFRSDNDKRDEHMDAMFERTKYPSIALDIKRVTKHGNSYVINGVLEMHGKRKPIAVAADIVKKEGVWHISSYFNVKVSDYGMEPPTLLFLSVRDRVDIHVKLTFKQ